MKRKFNRKQLEILKKCWEEKTPITVEGVNDRGDSFVTIGKISTSANGKKGLYDERLIYLDFGIEKYDPESDSMSPFTFAPFVLNMEETELIEHLMIKRLLVNGKEIYKAKDEHQIDRVIKKNKEQIEPVELRQGDVVSRALTHLVGQPININGERAVLIGVKEKGRIVIINGPFIELTKVHEGSELFTESDDGQTFLLASNVTGYCDPQLDSLDKDDVENE